MTSQYECEHIERLYAKMIAERKHFGDLSKAAAMWGAANALITRTHQELSTRKTLLMETWRDDAGRALGTEIDRSLASLKAWMDSIAKSSPAPHINGLSISIDLMYGTVQAIYNRYLAAARAGTLDNAALVSFSRQAAPTMVALDAAYAQIAGRMSGVAGPEWAGPRAGLSGDDGGPQPTSPSTPSPAATPDPASTPDPATTTPQPTTPQPTESDETDPLSTALEKVPEILSQLSQLAQSGQQLLSGLDAGSVPDPMTGLDPKFMDPIDSAEYAITDHGTGSGMPELAGLSGASGLGGAIGPVSGFGGPPGSAMPSAMGAAGLTAVGMPLATGAAGLASASSGGMPPMMPPHAANNGATGGGIKPGAAENAGRPRDRRSTTTPGIPAALRGRSGTPKAGARPAARPHQEPTNPLLDDELWVTDENPDRAPHVRSRP
ncbi:Flagelliform silk protein [Alloactinosynnema sp. L-07]|uniref:hypothetical protein n=1 Tax=Alloactinosynnema sp. L-07 TaxID=1653480 RepID=UPI00065EFC5F|nr:hypothetical protein [Alloactinosynnema sp. L-07]CRK58764.1 Flagelliform silk protein [Alloactinosynnema sp. L-07]